MREADSTSVGEVAKKHKVSEASIYAWRKHFGQLEAADVKRSKALEWFRSRREAVVIIEAWRRHYNAVRPHSSLDDLTLTSRNEWLETAEQVKVMCCARVF